MENDEVQLTLNFKQLSIIRDALKGELVRSNDMNFDYLEKVTRVGQIIESELRCNNAL